MARGGKAALSATECQWPSQLPLPLRHGRFNGPPGGGHEAPRCWPPDCQPELTWADSPGRPGPRPPPGPGLRPPHTVRGARRAAGPGPRGPGGLGEVVTVKRGFRPLAGPGRPQRVVPVWGLHFNATRTVLSEQRPIPVAGRLYALRLLPDSDCQWAMQWHQWAMHLTHYHSMILVMKNGITK